MVSSTLCAPLLHQIYAILNLMQNLWSGVQHYGWLPITWAGPPP